MVEPARDVGIDYEGEFALWEVHAVLDAARDSIIQMQMEDMLGSDGDDEGEGNLE